MAQPFPDQVSARQNSCTDSMLDNITDKADKFLTPICSLSFDILYAIFIICNNYSAKFRVIASQVCRQWRLAAIESSALWSRIQFAEKRPFWEKYEVWLTRSRDAPLTIEVSGVLFEKSGIKNLKKSLRLILPHTTRLLSITVNDAPEKIIRILIERIRFMPLPKLRRMHLSSLDDDHPTWRPTHFVHGTPALRHLVLDHTPINSASLILSNLITLTICDRRGGISPPLTDFKYLIRSLLTRSPNLRALHINKWDALTPKIVPDSSSTLLVHNSLRTLEVQSSTVPHFLREVQAPELSKIQFNGRPPTLPLSILSTFARWSTPSSLPFAIFLGEESPTEHRLWLSYMPVALGVLSALKSLYFVEVHFGGDHSELVACLGRLCPQLKGLSLRRCHGVTGAELRTLVAARKMSNVVTHIRILEIGELEAGPLIMDDDTVQQMGSMGYRCLNEDLSYLWKYNCDEVKADSDSSRIT